MNSLPSARQVPRYIKYFFVLASTVLTFYVIIIAKPIINSLLPAAILALLLRPFSACLEKIKIPRALSTVFAILLVLIVITALSFFFSSQVAPITADMDSLVSTFNSMFDKAQQWTAQQFGIAPHEQVVYLKSSLTTLLKNSSTFFRSTLSATAGFFTAFFLFILALFFFLHYRTFLASFLFQIFHEDSHNNVRNTLHKIEKVVRKYILGLCLVILTMATLNTLGLLLLGIKHAFFFGGLAALLTIIPYVGIIIGSILPILFAVATTDSLWYPVGVLLIFIFVQFLEGNFITPNVVGTQVSINPFAAILGLFVGGMVLGVMGVIFALPILAIIKVICDEVDSLKPIGFLLGNPVNPKKLKKQ